MAMGDFMSKIKKANNMLGLRWMGPQSSQQDESDMSINVEEEGEDIFNKELQDEEEPRNKEQPKDVSGGDVNLTEEEL